MMLPNHNIINNQYNDLYFYIYMLHISSTYYLIKINTFKIMLYLIFIFFTLSARRWYKLFREFDNVQKVKYPFVLPLLKIFFQFLVLFGSEVVDSKRI